MKVGDTIPIGKVKEMAPDYVAFLEGDWDKWDSVTAKFEELKQGQKCLTFDNTSKEYKVVKVASINHSDIRAIDGPVVRVRDNQYSWRVDGSGYAYPIKERA
jgi:hypothetical protein